MRIAVTGASGFIGGVVARELAAQGHTVFTYGRRHADAIVSPIANYTQWDLSTGATKAPEVNAVVHCAAQVGDWGLETDYRQVNVDGTKAVLETFRNTDRFVHVSSASVYSSSPPSRHLTMWPSQRMGGTGTSPWLASIGSLSSTRRTAS